MFARRNTYQRFFLAAIVPLLMNTFMVFCLEAADKFVDFSLEDLNETKHSQTDLKDKISLVVLQSRTTLQTAIDCKAELKKLLTENQRTQLIAIMDLRKKPALAPKFAVKSKISSQDTTSKEIPFLLDWDGKVTEALGGKDDICNILVVDPELNVVYKQEYKKAVIDSEIRPLLVKLSKGQR